VTVAGLPHRRLPLGTELYRIHRAGRGPWLFDASGLGRFDPVAATGRGASYWALDPLGAWVEVFRARMLLTDEDISERRLTVATLTEPLAVVDLAVARARKSGVTAAMTSGADYTAAQQLPSRIQDTERAIRWRLRHDLRGTSLGLVLFAPAGTAEPSGLHTGGAEELSGDLVKQAVSVFGYEILPAPPP
jgi:hypothetical protein